MSEKQMASVVILGEASPSDQIDHYILDVILNQTYKNLDLMIITVPRNDLEELQDKWNVAEKKCTIRFLEASPGVDLVAMGTDSAIGEVVFYKTCGSIAWFPHHIEAHITELNKDKKAKWSLSHIEKRDVNRPQEILNVLGWRIDNPPKIEEVIIEMPM